MTSPHPPTKLRVAVRVTAITALFLLMAVGMAADAYVRKGTWVETMLAARVAVRQAKPALDVTMGEWYLSPSFKLKSITDSAWPERGVDLKAENSRGRQVWKRQSDFADGKINRLPSGGNVRYTYRKIQCPAGGEMPVGIGCDDCCAIWLNGERVFVHSVPRGIAPNQDVATLKLVPGDNELLFKTWDKGGAFAFYFARLDDPCRDLWQRLKKDFPRETALMEDDLKDGHLGWFKQTDSTAVDEQMIKRALAAGKPFDGALRKRMGDLADTSADDPAWLSLYVDACTLRDRTAIVREADALIQQSGDAAKELRAEFATLADKQIDPGAAPWTDLKKRAQSLKSRVDAERARGRSRIEQLERADIAALRRAIADLTATFGDRYSNGPSFLASLEEMEKQLPAVLADAKAERLGAVEEAEKLLRRLKAPLLANPLLDVGRLAVLRRTFPGDARRIVGSRLGTPGLNSHTNDDIKHTGWDNEIVLVSDLRAVTPETETIYRPPADFILRDMDIEFDADRIMYSSITEKDRWGVFEIRIDPESGGMREGTAPRLLSPLLDDVDFFDSCYLPNGKVITCSTAGYQGLPCENGGRPMTNLYLIDPNDDSVRQLTFEQDSDWHPVALNNGRIMYLRWEYTDTPHYYTRILFHMNPDGTNQSELYGSGSYFPTAFKHARPVPNSSRVVGIVSGHHATPESGRLCVIDPNFSRKYPFRHSPEKKDWGPPGSAFNVAPEIASPERSGFVNEIPGWGEPVIGNVYDGQGSDQLKNGKPLFLYPYPLSEKYFLVSMKAHSDGLWGIYLVDVFDNMTLIYEEEDAALLEVIPLRRTERPPVIPERITPGSENAVVLLTDIYQGVGLRGIPRGKVKKLRLLSYHFAYLRTGGHASVGIESSWDIKRVLGTVPVEQDGSACFLVPANTPLAMQPLDENGAALQLMRSWFVGMPGEVVSCVGCHEPQNDTAPVRSTIAARRAPSRITPWQGQARPFAFDFEVQPILDRYCVGCHDRESPRYRDRTGNGRPMPDFVKRNGGDNWSTSYRELHAYVRRPGPESDLEPLQPMEYHVSTSELVQMLRKGHHGVALDPGSWERLYAWIDFNAPYRGAWNPGGWRVDDQAKRRCELAEKYAGVSTNPEAEYDALAAASEGRTIETVLPANVTRPPATVPDVRGWPFSADTAREMQPTDTKLIDLGGGFVVKLRRIPSGAFAMGSTTGAPDEMPCCEVRIDKAFWIAETETTNGQYGRLDPEHDTRYIDEHGKDHASPGFIANHLDQPVARVSWEEAMAFCRWLSARTGQSVSLPTEAQWEWAARAGSATQFHYGDSNTDFAKLANLADRSLHFTKSGYPGGSRLRKAQPYDDMLNYPLRDNRFSDGSVAPNYVAQYEPNAWGLHDTVGNVCEWTRTSYRPYPYRADDGRNDGTNVDPKVARGGSWHHRPLDAGSSVRLAYEPYQKVFNVGFRIVVED